MLSTTLLASLVDLEGSAGCDLASFLSNVALAALNDGLPDHAGARSLKNAPAASTKSTTRRVPNDSSPLSLDVTTRSSYTPTASGNSSIYK
ncbi:hypothetical protein VNO80_31205 [Phaseolus coccineus]|uniref:Uncharacterized protein n=1 Tax=Phaseolus coccineus TaxID=3886 RepID=A0AAN9LC59_PHACN